ncbi:MAG TPA: alpha/beta fold hydrolase [Mycobacteriales bacterium]|nr:alpha/beta fold hydrolase [Mycobacteriales bacterium]
MKDALSRAGSATRRGIRTVCSTDGLRGSAVEFAWISAHVATYPLGLLAERGRQRVDRFTLDGLPPVQRGLVIGDVEAAGTPILLVHGMVDNRSVFTLLRRGLRRRGFGRVTTMNYPVLTSDVRTAARHLGVQVERICEESGYERVHVVGHSLGGLIARYYVQRLAGDARVHTLVTLGSPHSGTNAARLLPQRITRQLRPGSDLIGELAEPAAGCRTRFVAFWTDLDALIVPKRSARVDHPDLTARNVLVRAVGHMSLPINRTVVHEICTTLAHLDSDGHTLAAGVTPIGATPPSVAHPPTPARLPRLPRRPARRGRAEASTGG